MSGHAIFFCLDYSGHSLQRSKEVFKLEIKDLIIYFSFQKSTETIADQKPLLGIFFSIFIVVLYEIFFKTFHYIGNFSSK